MRLEDHLSGMPVMIAVPSTTVSGQRQVRKQDQNYRIIRYRCVSWMHQRRVGCGRRPIGTGSRHPINRPEFRPDYASGNRGVARLIHCGKLK